MSITQNSPIHLCIHPHGVYTYACAYIHMYLRLTSLAKNQIMLPPCRLQSHLESSTCCCCCSFLLLVAVVVFVSLFYRFVVAVSIGRLCLGSSACFGYISIFCILYVSLPSSSCFRYIHLTHLPHTPIASRRVLHSYSYSYFILLLLSVIIQFAVAAQFY